MWGFARFSCIQVEVQCDSRVHLSGLAIENERPVLPLPDGRNCRGHKERKTVSASDASALRYYAGTGRIACATEQKKKGRLRA